RIHPRGVRHDGPFLPDDSRGARPPDVLARPVREGPRRIFEGVELWSSRGRDNPEERRPPSLRLDDDARDVRYVPWDLRRHPSLARHRWPGTEGPVCPGGWPLLRVPRHVVVPLARGWQPSDMTCPVPIVARSA